MTRILINITVFDLSQGLNELTISEAMSYPKAAPDKVETCLTKLYAPVEPKISINAYKCFAGIESYTSINIFFGVKSYKILPLFTIPIGHERCFCWTSSMVSYLKLEKIVLKLVIS